MVHQPSRGGELGVSRDGESAASGAQYLETLQVGEGRAITGGQAEVYLLIPQGQRSILQHYRTLTRVIRIHKTNSECKLISLLPWQGGGHLKEPRVLK